MGPGERESAAWALQRKGERAVPRNCTRSPQKRRETADLTSRAGPSVAPWTAFSADSAGLKGHSELSRPTRWSQSMAVSLASSGWRPEPMPSWSSGQRHLRPLVPADPVAALHRGWSPHQSPRRENSWFLWVLLVSFGVQSVLWVYSGLEEGGVSP